MAGDGFGAFSKRVDGIASEFTGKAKEDRLKLIGKLSEKDIEFAVGNDWPLHGLRNWRRNNVVKVVGHSELSNTVEGGIWMAPGVTGGSWRRGFGPMRVMSDGRSASKFDERFGHYRDGGLGKVRKDGTRKMKRRRVSRAYGGTSGRDTWNDAEKLIEQNIGKRINEAYVLDVLKRHLS